MSKKLNKYKDAPKKTYELKNRSGFDEYIGLGRPLDIVDDLSQRTAVAIAILCLVGGIIWKMVNGMNFTDAGMFAVGMAMSIIFSFMIGQELDPDRKLGGLIGGVLSALAFAFFGTGDWVVTLWLLWILRMFTRTSGDRHQIGDNVIILGCAAYLGWEGYYLYPMLTAAAYVMESQIIYGYSSSLYLAGIAFGSLVFAKFNVHDNSLNANYLYFLMVVLFIFLPEIRLARYTKAVGDKSYQPISGSRLQIGCGFFLMIIASLSLLHGNKAVMALIPAIMAAIGCGVNLFRALVMKEVNVK
ncbi:MAG: hypothetical protein Q4D21_00440 [Phascolarctobacterium sp.]|nr:hypothetical protein [Phascolarctobacterium sp.]